MKLLRTLRTRFRFITCNSGYIYIHPSVWIVSNSFALLCLHCLFLICFASDRLAWNPICTSMSIPIWSSGNAPQFLKLLTWTWEQWTVGLCTIGGSIGGSKRAGPCGGSHTSNSWCKLVTHTEQGSSSPSHWTLFAKLDANEGWKPNLRTCQSGWNPNRWKRIQQVHLLCMWNFWQ